jgi:DNA-binding transcriptional MerR regulator/methylmalonyl-CoA mutase cobalamin-binding subunit
MDRPQSEAVVRPLTHRPHRSNIDPHDRSQQRDAFDQRRSPMGESNRQKTDPASMLSIGAVSNATNIPAPTLRTWERRYGFPDPCRTDAGHRLYHPDVIERLRLTSRAIDAGHRPSNVVGMSIGDLRELLETSGLDRGGYRAARPDPEEILDEQDDEDDWLDDWLEATRGLNGAALSRRFRHGWNRLGGLDFLTRRVAPFLTAVGEAWADGELKVVHEHYASEHLRDFLSSQWRPISDRSRGPKAVCATPEDEMHALGLHIAALILAMADWQLVFLGANTPLDEVLTAVESESPEAVAISISLSFDSDRGRDFITQLKDRLPDDVELMCGGEGSPEVPGTTKFDDLESFYRWAFRRAQ